jgi:hypothetical protein
LKDIVEVMKGKKLKRKHRKRKHRKIYYTYAKHMTKIKSKKK